VSRLRPDVLLLDLEMPRLSGLAVLERLRTVAPSLPVIMCSAYTECGARSTLDALARGAKDYVMKPGQHRDFAAALDFLMSQLLPKIAALAGDGIAEKTLAPLHRNPVVDFACAEAPQVQAVVIGVSTGGPSALEALLPRLPRDFAVPILIVQHMPKLFTSALADRLNRLCEMHVLQAADGASAVPGKVFLAPGDAHMEVVHGLRGPAIHLHQGPALNSCRPSVDYLFQSAAQTFGAGTLALVMTGMGSDGVEGAASVRDAGGTVLVQDEATSAVWGMPGRVVQAGLASAALPLNLLADALLQRVAFGRTRQQIKKISSAVSSVQPEVICGVL
jgi:two-component system chemotaxis response regulator CheB